MGNVSGCRIVSLPKIPDARGNLSFVEGTRHIPFAVRRAYWIYEVPGGEERGGHAFRESHEFIVALSGSFDVVADDGQTQVRFTLNRSYFGLYLPNLIWREIGNFSSNSLCLVLSSTGYSEQDYLRSHDEFLRIQRGSA